MKNLLSAKNLSVTQLRLRVLEVFGNHDSAISIEQIENELEKFDRVSLYRTLKTFREKGIIHDIMLSDGEKKMALCPDKCKEESHEHNHIHFLCKLCKAVFCVDIETPPTLGLNGFMVDTIDIQASGFCKNCNSNRTLS